MLVLSGPAIVSFARHARTSPGGIVLSASPARHAPPHRRAAAARASRRRALKRYEGRYYVINTDLAGDDLREADLRMTKMAEEYKKRTEGFSGTIGHKFPFFLFRDLDDYHAAGGMQGTAGVFNPNTDTLMAIAGEKTTAYTWSVIQHEGFHQFARTVIGGELPIWVNEGMAEYFGEGHLHRRRFRHRRHPAEAAQADQGAASSRSKFQPIKEMMLLTHARLEPGDVAARTTTRRGRWCSSSRTRRTASTQGAFVEFMRAIGTGQQWDAAWLNSFGSAEGFEKKLDAILDEARRRPDAAPVRPGGDGNDHRRPRPRDGAEAEVRVVRRARRQSAKANEVRIDNRDWLPPRLIDSAFARGREDAGAGGEVRAAARPGRRGCR